LTYPRRLESDKVDDSLERGNEAGSATARGAGKPAPAAKTPASPAPAPTPSPAAKAAAAAQPPATPAPQPSATPSPETATKPLAAAPPVSASAAAAPPAKVSTVDKHAPNAAPGTFYVQVGAFKDKAAAERIVAQLKQKSFAAYGTEGPDGFFNV